MRDWNVVISVREMGFRPAFELLEELGPVAKTDFYNILVMKVDDIGNFLETLREWVREDTHILSLIRMNTGLLQGLRYRGPGPEAVFRQCLTLLPVQNTLRIKALNNTAKRTLKS